MRPENFLNSWREPQVVWYLVTTWEQEIDARDGLEDIGAHADTAYNNATAAATTEAQRKAVKVIIAKDGKLSLGKIKRSMPAVVGGEVGVSGLCPPPAGEA